MMCFEPEQRLSVYPIKQSTGAWIFYDYASLKVSNATAAYRREQPGVALTMERAHQSNE